MEPAPRPMVLLAGDASARPTGLERALTRAGFQLVEQGDELPGVTPDAILVTLTDPDQPRLKALFPDPNSNTPPGPPRVVVLTSSDPDAAAVALEHGADDALAAPVHLPELAARLHARIRQRAGGGSGVAPAATAAEGAAESSGSGALTRRVEEEFERARRYSLSFSLVLLGVDELEALPVLTESAGTDQRQREMSGVLRRELRLPDFVTPYAAGEFAIVLPETDQAGARQSILRIRDRLASLRADDPRPEPSRFSAGIVTYPHPAASETGDLFALVEAALMRGKAQSGERIAVAM
jgi:diguanylate cyclase (GGDEF)-like protein